MLGEEKVKKLRGQDGRILLTGITNELYTSVLHPQRTSLSKCISFSVELMSKMKLHQEILRGGSSSGMVIPECGRRRQKDHKFQAQLGSRARLPNNKNEER